MPITHRSRSASSERLFQTTMDWTRRIMQLAALAVVVLYAYLLYGLIFGAVGQWQSLGPEQKRIATNIEGAVLYLNIALGILLLTVCILYYDEESVGYTLVAGAVALYYGLPFLLDAAFADQVKHWESPGNVAALAILNQFRIAAIMMAVPGGILTIRDLILRFVDASSRKREEFNNMQYGSLVKEEPPPNPPIIGLFAKCWQLPYCRDAIRKACPIYHARTKCWRERVGCMCEENVIRHAMDSLIGKETITRVDDASLLHEERTEGLVIGQTVADKTEEVPPRPFTPPSPGQVKIPHNPNLPMSVKKERCRNCVIYNEHQRMKYQFWAPLFVLVVPGLAIWQFTAITEVLRTVLATVDKAMQRLALTQNPTQTGISNLTSGTVAEYVVIGCLIVIITTMVLRVLEYFIFRLKI